MNGHLAECLALSLALAAGDAAVATAAGSSDAKADEIAQSMMKAMGGQDNWTRAHFVRFDFRVVDKDKVAVDRAHLWDKMTGRYRLESKTKDGKDLVTLFNTGSREGTAYVDGKKLDSEAAKQALKDGYGAFINDMYWLAMPWKWTDAGVNLKYAGKKNRGNKSYDVVQLTFGNVGLTPGDRYDAYVSTQSHLMEYWEYFLQSGRKGAATWEYVTTSGLKLAGNHTGADGRSINMGNVKVLESVDDALFNDPSKKLR